jgi:hypothetical protein
MHAECRHASCWESPSLILGEPNVSNADGKQPDFDEFNLPGDEEQLENLEELDLPETSDPIGGLGGFDLPDGSDPLADIGEGQGAGPEPFGDGTEGIEEATAVGDESDTDMEESEAEAVDKKKKPTRVSGEGVGMAGLAVFGFCGLSVFLLFALDAMVFMSWGFFFMLFMNIFWLMATAIPLIMWLGRKRLNFYEILLGISLAAIIIAVALLLAEFAEYEGEATPKGGTASAVQLGSERTIAVA